MPHVKRVGTEREEDAWVFPWDPWNQDILPLSSALMHIVGLETGRQGEMDNGCCLWLLLSPAQRADTEWDIRSFCSGLTGLEEQKEIQKGLLLTFPNSDDKVTKFHSDTWHTGPQHNTGMSPQISPN